MLKIDLAALEQLLQDFSGELDSLAFHEVQNNPAYRKLEQEIKAITEHHPIIPFLYEGDRQALGYTIAEEDLQAFRKYYDLVHEREKFFFEKAFCYGVVMGSNLFRNVDRVKNDSNIIKLERKP